MPGGPGRFGRGSSGPALLRVPTARGPPPPTGLSPPAGRPSSRFGPAGRALPWALLPRGGPKTPPVWAPAPLARRYAGHHCCLLLLRLLGCFGSPGARPLAGAPGLQPGGLPHSDTPGSPALCASPGIFAAERVLHRLREPGHPPCALPSLPARSRRAAAPSRARRRPRAGLGPFLSSASSSSVFLCLAAPAPRGGRRARCAVPMNDAWRMPASNRRPPACKAGALPAELIPPRATPPGVVPPGFEPGASTLSVWRSDRLSYGTRPRPARRRGRGMAMRGPGGALGRAPSRKEVFQPHLPVRLPCYDLAPVAGLALDRPSRARASGAPGSHGLTGGVYKARERIHRAVADARLLANPASRGRVADPDPNRGRLSGFAPPRGVAARCAGHCNTCVAPDVGAVLI